MKYCVEITRGYMVEAENEDEAIKEVLSATPEVLAEYHKAAECWEEVTAVYDEDTMQEFSSYN